MSYRDELVQAGAVVVAMIQAEDNGAAVIEGVSHVLLELFGERQRQNGKWGVQVHDRATWLAILMEEVGEAAQAHLQETYESGAVLDKEGNP